MHEGWQDGRHTSWPFPAMYGGGFSRGNGSTESQGVYAYSSMWISIGWCALTRGLCIDGGIFYLSRWAARTRFSELMQARICPSACVVYMCHSDVSTDVACTLGIVSLPKDACTAIEKQVHSRDATIVFMSSTAGQNG